MRTWRWGLVGSGRMAATMMACFQACERARVVAVAASGPGRAAGFAARFGIERAHDDLGALLRHDDLDAVYIANATADHASTAIAALAAGKAVLCEKPFALSAAEGALVTAAVERSGRLFMEAQWTACLPAVRALREMVQSRSLGEVQHLYSEFGQSLDEASHPRLFLGPGSGVLLDFGVYPITLALQLLGPVESLCASIAYSAAATDVQAALQLAHRNGACSQLAVSLRAALPNSSALSASHGSVRLVSPVMGVESLWVRPAAPAIGAIGGTGSEGAGGRVTAALRRHGWLRRLNAALPRGSRHAHGYGTDRYLPQLQHFTSLLDQGARVSDLMPPEMSMDVLRVIDLARRDSPPPI